MPSGCSPTPPTRSASPSSAGATRCPNSSSVRELGIEDRVELRNELCRQRSCRRSSPAPISASSRTATTSSRTVCFRRSSSNTRPSGFRTSPPERPRSSATSATLWSILHAGRCRGPGSGRPRSLRVPDEIERLAARRRRVQACAQLAGRRTRLRRAGPRFRDEREMTVHGLQSLEGSTSLRNCLNGAWSASIGYTTKYDQRSARLCTYS